MSEALLLAFAAIQALTSGVSFAADLSGAKVKLAVSLREVIAGRKATALAFIRVTNESDVPWSVTDFKLTMGDAVVGRVPGLHVKTGTDQGQDILGVTPAIGDMFETGRVLGLSSLEDDLYLLPNKSRGGWVMFAEPGKPPVFTGKATLSVCVGDGNWIDHEFEIPQG